MLCRHRIPSTGHRAAVGQRFHREAMDPRERTGGTLKSKSSFEGVPMRRMLTLALVSYVAIFGSGTSAAAAKIRNASDYFLSTGPTSQSTVDVQHRNVSETFSLVNGNSRNVYVRRIGADGPGLVLRKSTGAALTGGLTLPTGPGMTWTVPPHQSIQLAVSFHVSDCSKVPKGAIPLTLDVAWRLGNWHRVSLQMPSEPLSPWPRSLTSLVCT